MAHATHARRHESSRHGKPTGPQGRRGQHGNPADLESHLRRMEAPERAAWQKPDAVVRALRLRPGQTVCEIGSGTGYFALRMARRVGPRGLVYAVDVDSFLLGALRDRVEKSGLRNVLPVLGLEDDPLVPPRSCDLVLLANSFHHFRDKARALTRFGKALKPGGRLVNVDFHRRALPVGPPVEETVSREEALALARRARFRVVEEHTFLPYQYFLVLARR